MHLCNLICFSLGIHYATGVTVSPCGRDNTAEVIQGQSTTFTCSGLSSGVQVDWMLGDNDVIFSAGTCPSVSSGGACIGGDFGPATTPSRVSDTESRLVIDPRLINDKSYVQQGTLQCQGSANRHDSCQTDYVVKAKGSCSVQTGTGSSRYQVTGTCTMSGASSSRGRYGCDWYRTGQSSPVVSKTLTAATYETGCNVSFSLPTSDGQYSYTATLIPGRRSVPAGSIDVARPATPSLPICDGGEYIQENTNVTCTCNTGNIGTPTGRLQWIKTGNPMTVLASGDYGRDSLTVSQTLQRADHQSTQFLCSVDWASDFPGLPVTFKVGYPPTTITIGLNQRQGDLTVDEHQTVSFQCQNSNGRPSPTVALLNQDNGTELASRELQLTHSVVARCEDSGDYVCTADNGMGPAVTSVARRLLVRCSPQGDEDIGEVIFTNDPVSVSFDVTAYPVPDTLTFTYLGESSTCTRNNQISNIDSDIIRLSGHCEVKPGVVYMSTCTVTVNNVTSVKAAGFYTVTVTNTRGSGQFIMEVQYNDVPAQDSPDSPSYLAVAVGFGVALAVSITIHLVVIVWLWRRQWTLPCAGKWHYKWRWTLSQKIHNQEPTRAPTTVCGCPTWARGLSTPRLVTMVT